MELFPMQFFAFFDRKSGLYSRPQMFPHVAEALRATERAVNDPKTFLGEHPADYDLYEVGFYSESLGVFTQHEGFEFPRHVIAVVSLLKTENGGTK